MTVLQDTLNNQPEHRTSYTCIIFYRWYTQDGKNRGRVMARTVAKTLEAMGVTVWLDQQQMSRQATREQVIAGIHKAFQRVQYVIILAAPGDWDRFVNEDDIHRWEWEISLKSRKPVWVLQYETICPRLDLLQTNLVHELLLFSNFLADLVLKRSIEVRSITTENFYDVLEEITKRPCIKTL
ncbi:uncharacterized protein C8R40DRAFT_1161310 [Lentinula edodes]|uniref:uncharacterized protein n=1 Tax=Lentinula edodes TaxID=5353 RepID=UPI001E8D4015|nr:uncharacterized protein C8R40DRAFT_1161310 [Lentinula edodes]KAH7873945.1 hypothetical protein C8R40DRAFT_1161310 [Lentinula edodes]